MNARIAIPLTIIVFVGLATLYVRDSQRIMSEKINSWSDEQRADCAVVLTGGPVRIHEGFDLLAQGRVRKLIVSGVYAQADLRSIFPAWPFYGPVSEDDVILEKRSTTTYGNAQQSLPLVEALKCHDVILVTSRVHMYRALRTFHAVFPTEIQIYPRAVISQHYEPAFWEVFFETLKAIFYDLWAY